MMSLPPFLYIFITIKVVKIKNANSIFTSQRCLQVLITSSCYYIFSCLQEQKSFSNIIKSSGKSQHAVNETQIYYYLIIFTSYKGCKLPSPKCHMGF